MIAPIRLLPVVRIFLNLLAGSEPWRFWRERNQFCLGRYRVVIDALHVTQTAHHAAADSGAADLHFLADQRYDRNVRARPFLWIFDNLVCCDQRAPYAMAVTLLELSAGDLRELLGILIIGYVVN